MKSWYVVTTVWVHNVDGNLYVGTDLELASSAEEAVGIVIKEAAAPDALVANHSMLRQDAKPIDVEYMTVEMNKANMP